jgi:nucleoside-diphosphate-sugar epimerase
MVNWYDEIKKTKVLVTGGLGFVGHNLVKTLVNEYQCEVVVIDNCANSSPEVLGDLIQKVSFHQVSVLDYEILFPLFSDVNYIFHLACVQIAAASTDAINDLRVNAESTLKILEHLKNTSLPVFKRFIYTSSCSIYGSSINNLPARESGACLPLSHYAATKMLGENYTMIYNKLYNVPISCVRYSNVFGYGQTPKNPYCGVLGKFIHNSLTGQSHQIYGDGEQTRDYTFITDAVQATILSAVHPQALGDVFNVGTGVETSVNMLQRIILNIQPGSTVDFVPERDIDNIRRRVVDIEKIHQKLGWSPKVNIQKGIEETMKWYKGLIH